jgi:hypothetical protein
MSKNKKIVGEAQRSGTGTSEVPSGSAEEAGQLRHNSLDALVEEGYLGSKIPFRIDYYRADKDAELKGVIEHILSHERRSFSGKGFEVMADFIDVFVSATETSEAPDSPSSEPSPDDDGESRMKLLSPEGRPLSNRMPANTPFQVSLSLKGHILDEQATQLARLSLLNLDTGKTQHITERFEPKGQHVLWPGTPILLPVGAYRLSAEIRSTETAPGILRESTFLVVG